MDRTRREVRDVTLEHDVAHEQMEERRHFEAIELAEERRVMEPDPSNGALFHRLLERGLRHRRPAVRRIVDLDEQVVRGEIGLVYRIGRTDVIDREALLDGRVLQPLYRRVSEWLMNRLAWFGERDHSVGRGPGRLRRRARLRSVGAAGERVVAPTAGTR